MEAPRRGRHLTYGKPPVDSYTPHRMEPLEQGSSVARRPRRRWRLWVCAALIAAAVWFAPQVVVLTTARDWPLHWASAGLDGRLSSRAAAWTWTAGIEYRDLVLTDATGRVTAAARRVGLDRGLLALAATPHDLGTVRITAPEVIVEVRRGGSSIEDMLAPWLARVSAATPFRCDLEVVDGVVHLVDGTDGDSWRIAEVLAAVGCGTTADDGWTVAGVVVHSGQPPRDLAAAFGAPAPGAGDRPPRPEGRLARTTVAAGATAILARAGGLSISAPPRAAAGALAVSGNAVPLGLSRVVATRFDQAWHAGGTADIRLAIQLPTAGGAADGLALRGAINAAPLVILAGPAPREVAGFERCDIPLDVVLGDGQVVVRTLTATAPALKAEASGRLALPTAGVWEWADTLVRDDFALAIDVDLAAAARAVPGGLEIRPDVRITGGKLQVAAAAHAAGADRLLEIQFEARDVAAVQGERPLRWNAPLGGWLRGRLEPGRFGRLTVEEARLAAPGIELAARGDRDELAVEWTADLAAVVADVGELVDVGGLSAAGLVRGRVDITGGGPVPGATAVRLAAGVERMALGLPGRPEWRDDEFSVTASGSGSAVVGGLVVDSGTLSCSAPGDILEARLAGGALVDPSRLAAWLGGRTPVGRVVTPAPTATDGIQVDVAVGGDLAAWQRRFGACAGTVLPVTSVAGHVQAQATLIGSADGWRVLRSSAEVDKPEVEVAGRRIAEPRLLASAAGGWQTGGEAEITAAEILTATMSVRTGGLAVRPAGAGRGDLLERLRGRAQWQADLSRLADWLGTAPAGAGHELSGRVWGSVDLVDTPTGQNLRAEIAGNHLALTEIAAAGPGRTVWSEPDAALAVEVTRPGGGDPAAPLAIDRLTLSSATLTVAAAGALGEPAGRRVVELGGTLAVDWDRLSALAVPWTAGRVRLSGGGPRPFQFRAPLRPAPPSTARRAVPFPAGWLAGQPAGAPDDAILPVEITPDPAAAGALRNVVLDAATAWNAADLDGLPLAAGEMPLRLLEGQLVFGPFDLAAAGGRLRGSPWLRLEPGPLELVVPPGRIAERITVSTEMAQRWIAFVSPLLGRATRTSGWVTIDGAGARLPVADPWSGEGACQVTFENLEVTPGAHVKPLADLIVRLQSVVDPRFAFGDKAVLLRVRPEPVRLHLAGGRLWQEGLVMDIGQLVVRSAGSVGGDGSLAMDVEIALRGDLVGTTPVLAKLVRTPLLVPLSGTIEQPRFDAAAIDAIIARIVDNTAEAVLRDGVGRGLEQLEILFGNPPAPAPR